MSKKMSLKQAEKAYYKAAKDLEDAYEREFPAGTTVYYDHGNNTIRATVAISLRCRFSPNGANTRILLLSECSDRTYWIYANRLRKEAPQ